MEEYLVDDKIKKKLFSMLFILIKLLDSNNIKYWSSGGTLLGIERHQDLIPWDDDIDIDIEYSKRNILKINNFKKNLEKHNIGIVKTNFGYKIFDKNGEHIKRNLWREHKEKFKKKNPLIRGRALISKHASKSYKRSNKPLFEKYKYPFIDIFLSKITNNKTSYLNNKWERCFHYEKDLFPLDTKKFGTLRIKTAKNPNNYLNGCYGKDWDKYGIINYNHRLEKMIKPIKISLNNLKIK